MVLGGPGVGKSTFLRKVGLEALRTLGRRDFAGKDPGNLLVPQAIFYQHPCIPVMLELRQFDKPDISIKAVIAEELETCGFPHPEDLTELFLKNGKLLVLLDGLDEGLFRICG
jgi:predicted NACHT family NTPase